MTATAAPAFAPDIQALLAPIPGDEPAGPWLRYEGTYDRVREARRSDNPNLPQGVWARDLKRADWQGAAALCQDALASRSKDLQLAAWLAEAWTGSHGFAGAAAGIATLLALCERWWDESWPRRDTDDETLEARALIFEWLDERMTTLLVQTPLTEPGIPDAGTYSWSEREAALRLENAARRDASLVKAAEAKGACTLPRFDRSAALTPTAVHAVRGAALARACDDLARLRTLLDARCGSAAPGLLRLVKLLATVRGWTDAVLAARPPESLPAPEPAMPETPEPVSAPAAESVPAAAEAPGAAPVRVAVAPPARPASREEAYRWLAVAADYLTVTEPHSPVPYLVRRALAWGQLSLPELTLELVGQGYDLNALRALLGFDEKKG